MSSISPFPLPAANTRIRQAVSGLQPISRSLLDAIILIALLRLAEIVFFGPQAYEQLGFHPFWLVVLLASMQRGLFAGVVAAIIATIAMGRPERPMDMDIVEYYIQLSSQPLQWLLAALLLGLFRGLELRERAALETALEMANEDKRLLAEELARADAALNHAETEAITRSSREPGRAVAALAALACEKDGPDLPAAFDNAAALVSTAPSLLVACQQDRMEVLAGDPVLCTRFAPDIDGNPALAEAMARPGPAILESGAVSAGTHGYLVVAPVRNNAGAARGAVVLLAQDSESADLGLGPASVLAAILTQRLAWERCDG